ncbi:MAG: hypothetical protein DWQ34_22460 [Planctomycetota bacterium]|nr:MAG: hypothetical protein DWQ34_22460 [Planctomycetota bacterium]REK30684.1 MAG: hypothetical protein DWQ41_01685 [Planctomycetota bacterium]REK33059.1 MAG: hypothetical protein DWQ45_15790 [Planctomycetota bacterium]
MEVSGATSDQLLAVYRSMPFAQRCTVILCAAAIGGWLCWLLLRPASSKMVPALGGRSLPPSEIDEISSQLDAAGLTEYEVDGSRLLAPEADVDRYDAVAADEADGPHSWGDTWREANSSLSQFALSRQRKDAGEIARAELLSKLLGELPGIDSAEIVWDEEARIGWRKPPKVRATVYLKPLEGHLLSPETVEAVRTAVAGSKAHLDPADVAVMDMRSMVTYSGDESLAGGSGGSESAARFTAACRGRVEHALAHITGVRVAVVVTESSEVNGSPDDWELPAVAPNARMELPPLDESEPGVASPTVARHEVSVQVSVPQSYFNGLLGQQTAGRQIAADQLHAARQEVEQRVVRDVQQRVTRALDGRLDASSAPVVEVAAYRDPPQPAAVAAVSEPVAAWPWISGVLQQHRWSAWVMATLVLGVCLWSAYWLARRLVVREVTPPKPLPAGGEEALPQQTADGEQTQPASSAPEPTPSDAGASGAASASSDRLAEALASLLQEPSGKESSEEATTIHETRFEIADHANEGRATAVPHAAESRSPVAGQANQPISDVSHAAEPAIGLAGFRLRSSEVPDDAPVDIEEILRCDPARLCRLFQQTSSDTWAAALVGASDAVQEHLSETLPRDDSKRLQQALRTRRPMRLHDVETAQREILSGLALDLA